MTPSRPRTLAEAMKKIAVLKREVTATRNRLVRERDAALVEAAAYVKWYHEMWTDRDNARRERDEALADLAHAVAALDEVKGAVE